MSSILVIRQRGAESFADEDNAAFVTGDYADALAVILELNPPANWWEQLFLCDTL
jgi:hypothetical protein